MRAYVPSLQPGCSHGPVTGTSGHLTEHASRPHLHLHLAPAAPREWKERNQKWLWWGVVAHAWNLYPGSSEAWPLTLCGTENISLGFSGGGGFGRALF